MFSAIFGDAPRHFYDPDGTHVGNRSPSFPGPLSLFTKRNRFCSRSGSPASPTYRNASRRSRARRPAAGPRYERTKRTRGNSTVIFAGATLFCPSTPVPRMCPGTQKPASCASFVFPDGDSCFNLARRKKWE